MMRWKTEPLVKTATMWMFNAPEPAPNLATSWSWSNQGKTLTMNLIKGVKWSDGVCCFDADDVLFSAHRAGNHPNARSSFGLNTKGKAFKKIDSHTIQVTTEKPYPLMAVDLSNVHIVSANEKDKWEGEYNNGNSAHGTGPYKVVKWVKGVKGVGSLAPLVFFLVYRRKKKIIPQILPRVKP